MKRFDLTRGLQRIAAAAFLLACCCSFTAHAEQSELRIAKQYGLGYLQMMVMEDQKIIEKNAKGVILISSGFGADSSDRASSVQRMREILRDSRTRVIGPNSLGVMNPLIGLNAMFPSSLTQIS